MFFPASTLSANVLSATAETRRNASCFVLPYAITPGRRAISAIQRPSSSRSNSTVKEVGVLERAFIETHHIISIQAALQRVLFIQRHTRVANRRGRALGGAPQLARISPFFQLEKRVYPERVCGRRLAYIDNLYTRVSNAPRLRKSESTSVFSGAMTATTTFFGSALSL